MKLDPEEYEKLRIASVMAEVQKGIDDVKAGRTHKFSKELFNEITLRARKKVKDSIF
jgi:predicted DNA-binding protein (UPF0251 family)